MLGKQFPLFSILGFSVKLDLSWVFLAILVTWSLSHGFFPYYFEGLETATYWWMGVVGALGLFFSIIFHELSHAVVARQYGLRISGITLFIFGGVAEMEEEPESPKAEFLMAIAGPIASVVLAAVFYGAAALGRVADLPVAMVGVAAYLGFINTLLAVFNLIPGFPLDGGRVLRAALWHFKGDLRQATRIAANIGSAFGMVLIALGVLNVIGGNFVGGMWWFLIGMFLRGAATSSYYQMMMRRTLEGEPVRRFMTQGPVTVPPDLSIAGFVEDHVYESYHDMYPVTEDGRLVGCIAVNQVKEVPREAWGRVTVGEIARAKSADNTVEAASDAVQALSLMRRTGNSRLMVTENGRLVGVIALKDILKMLAMKIDLGDVGGAGVSRPAIPEN